MKPIQQILFATDFSAGARAARDKAIELAQKLHAKITLLHVFEMPLALSTMPYGVSPEPLFALQQKLRENALAEVEREVDEIKTEGVACVGALLDGSTVDEIVQYAKSFDLLVMGTHGRTGISHALLGSVTEKVLRRSEIPVLSVRMQTK